LLDLILTLAGLGAVGVLFYKHDSFGITGLQVFGPFSLPVLMPPPDHMICGTSIQAIVGTAYHVHKPSIHEFILVAIEEVIEPLVYPVFASSDRRNLASMEL
jgi:hypothetical protein